jgi:hypothetical protein
MTRCDSIERVAEPHSTLRAEVRKRVGEVLLVLRFVVSRHVEKLNFGSQHREASQSRLHNLRDRPTNRGLPAEDPLVVLNILEEQVELVGAAPRLGLKRRTRDLLSSPDSPPAPERVDAEQVPVHGQFAMNDGLVVTSYGDLHVVVFPSDLSQPQVDRPGWPTTPRVVPSRMQRVPELSSHRRSAPRQIARDALA